MNVCHDKSPLSFPCSQKLISLISTQSQMGTTQIIFLLSLSLSVQGELADNLIKTSFLKVNIHSVTLSIHKEVFVDMTKMRPI